MSYFLKLLIASLLICSTFLTGCGSAAPSVKPFKMDIQQGNVVTSKMLLQLKPGMTKSQVRFIMGTPLIVDSFHSNRWDYFYQMRKAGKIIEQRRVILEFEKELLLRVRGDVVPEGTAGADSGAEAGVMTLPKSIEPKPKEKGLLDKLKFWQKDPKPAEVKPAAKEAVPALPVVAPETKQEAAPGNASQTNIDAPSGDAPSVLAVPVGGVLMPDTPNSDVPAPSAPEVTIPEAVVPAVEAPKVEMPAPEPVKIEPLKPEPVKAVPPVVDVPKAEAPKPLPTKAAPTPIAPSQPTTNPDEQFSFRMDKNLDVKNLETAPVEAAPGVKPKKVEVPPPQPEEEPGYFERMLEKIGF